MGKKKKNYVESSEIEAHWTNWLETKSEESWNELLSQIYKICQGVAVKFSPRDEEEHLELCHETFALTVEKIKNGKLTFEPGRAPVFNLLTTTIFRHLYSLKNKDNRRRRLLLTKFLQKPGTLEKIVGVSDISGYAKKHPESERILSNVLPTISESPPQPH